MPTLTPLRATARLMCSMNNLARVGDENAARPRLIFR